jgi:hypothetical protein
MDPACADSCPTHAETLVHIDIHGTEVLSVQDAYFDITYVDKNGNPLDYFEMLSLLQNQRHEDIRIAPSPDHEFHRDLLLRTNETRLTISGWLPPRSADEPFEYVDNSTVLYRVSFGVSLYERRSPLVHRFFRDVLARDGYPENLIYLHLYRFRVDRISIHDDLYRSKDRAEALLDLSILEHALAASQPWKEFSVTGIPQSESALPLLVIGAALVLGVCALMYSRWRKCQDRTRTARERKLE